MNVLKIILSIINEADQPELLEQLNQQGYHATILSTTGDFMRYGRATFIVGVEEQQVNEVIAIIKEHAKSVLKADHKSDEHGFLYVIDIHDFLHMDKEQK